MDKGKGQGRSCLARRLLTLLEQSKEGGGMDKGKGQGRSCLARRLLEAHQERALRDSTMFFALDWVDNSPGQQAGGVLILYDNTTKRVALLGGQLCDNTTEKAVLSCNTLWSQCPYEVVMSFTCSKPDPRAVRKIGRNLSGTTHPTLPPIGGRPSYSRPKRNCSDLE
uniref:Uncharacterized protein n=1 Tax=Tanacetum cinerariifolium TaxID=118510 RepID=A0A6L2L854_TANCI|nr:hypothetical protein CRG98_042609 [Tanacetum cinerariifolium]